jgi:hypothetical protein
MLSKMVARRLVLVLVFFFGDSEIHLPLLIFLEFDIFRTDYNLPKLARLCGLDGLGDKLLGFYMFLFNVDEVFRFVNLVVFRIVRINNLLPNRLNPRFIILS